MIQGLQIYCKYDTASWSRHRISRDIRRFSRPTSSVAALAMVLALFYSLLAFFVFSWFFHSPCLIFGYSESQN
jgi:hypothetical protein